MNQIFSAFLIILTTIGGAIGISADDQFTSDINKNVDNVSNVVNGVADSQAKYLEGNMGIGQFRCDCQDAKQYITLKYQTASDDTELSLEQKELNENYRKYLLECLNVVSEYQKGEQPDTSKMDELRNKFN